MKRVNLTLTDEQYSQLLESYAIFLKRFNDDPKQTGMLPSITGYAAGCLMFTIKRILLKEKKH